MRSLHLLGTASLLIYAAVLALSFRFLGSVPLRERPILEVVALLAVATLVYLVAVGLTLRREQDQPDDAPRWRVVLLYSILFRLLLLPSLPIQEVDFYRYLWDGRVFSHGFNPYRYSPHQIEIMGQEEDAPGEVTALWQLGHQSPAVTRIFEGVHHRAVPTVYPPAAQVVFAVSALITPAAAPVWFHVLILKAIFLGFDIGTLWLLASLLRLLGRPRSWALAYGWCPLALKEIANSGHLDAIAVFLTILAVYLVVRAVSTPPSRPLATAALAALAAAMLAKSYPVILIPVFAAFLFAHWRGRALIPLAAFGLIVVVGYAPFLNGRVERPADDEIGLVDRHTHHPGSGLQTFLTRWEMNDFLFMIVHENLTWSPVERPDPWFVVIPNRCRQMLREEVLERWVDVERLPSGADPMFLVTQIIMGSILAILCLRWAWQVYSGGGQPDALLRGVFLSLVWGWLLTSAQNPWYLLWSLAFMVFAKGRAWFLLPGLVLLYYVRFWLEYHAPDTDAGPSDVLAFFDYYVVWLEYTPFYLALLLEFLWQRWTH